MALARIVLAAAVLVTVAQLAVGAARADAPDPKAVEAYVETLESLHAEGVAIGDRIFKTHRTIDDVLGGNIERADLARRLNPTFEALYGDIAKHRRAVLGGVRPVNTGDIERNRELLASAMALAAMVDVLDSIMVATENLQVSVVGSDAEGYQRAEIDVLDLRADIYNARNLFLTGQWSGFDRGDPMFGIYMAGMGINEAGARTFKILTKSTRTGNFDPAAYTEAIEPSLRLIVSGLASSEEKTADPSWLATGSADDAAANTRRREKGMALAQKYFAGTRDFIDVTRAILEKQRSESGGKSQLSGSAMLRHIRAIRMIMGQVLDAATELDQTRRELARLARAANAD